MDELNGVIGVVGGVIGVVDGAIEVVTKPFRPLATFPAGLFADYLVDRNQVLERLPRYSMKPTKNVRNGSLTVFWNAHRTRSLKKDWHLCLKFSLAHWEESTALGS
jgi:hypothetical protein